MKVVTVHEARIDLLRRIHEALQGEEILSGGGSDPRVRLVPSSPRVSSEALAGPGAR